MIKKTARHIATIAGSAMILMFFSEYFFLNELSARVILEGIREDPIRMLGEIGLLWLFYCFFTCALLLVIAHFKVRRLSGLFLAGALFGWIVEGGNIAVVYESIPVSFIFPSVSWHALVDVMLGWYFVRWLMRQRKPALSTIFFLVLGAVWGAWATWFWAETGMLAPIPPGQFALYAAVTGILWIAGMYLLDQAGESPFKPGQWETRIFLIIAAGLFAVTAWPYLPASLLLMALIGLTLWALARGRKVVLGGLKPLPKRKPYKRQYSIALLTPLAASVVYPLFYESGRRVPTEEITFFLLTAGAILLAVAIVYEFTVKKN